MKTWKKPEVSKTNQELTILTENEAKEVDGGWKIGACLMVGAGGDMTKLKSGVFMGLCYVVGI
jgi:hypothetical protein